MNWHWKTAVTLALAIAFMAVEHRPANSQIVGNVGSRELPRLNYYQSFTRHRNAEFTRANRDFRQAYASAYQFGQNRFLDSACCLTMIGECHFQVGNYADALASYEQALQLYLSHNKQNWQRRIQLPEIVAVDAGATQRSGVSWGTSTRSTSIPNIPSTFLVMFGRVDALRVFQEGGVFDQANLRSVNVTEIMRCMSLAIHRRRHILGPLNKTTPLTSQLLSGLTIRGAGDGSIMGSYNGVLLGIALASVDRDEDAVRMLTSSLQIQNKFDHSLTPVALVELTRLAMKGGKNKEAAKLALEASYAAGIFGQYDMVDEALSLGTTNHLLTAKTPYPPLANAIQWCNREQYRLPQLSLIRRLAESRLESGDSKAAVETISGARSASRGRNDLEATVANAKLKYTTAMVSFTDGNLAEGRADLSAALKQYENGSLWLFRLRLVADLIATKGVSELEADKLYASLLRDPTDQDWKFDPIEPLSFLATDHVTAMENWFEILIRRRQFERALEVTELIRRHRFYATLPMGGRLLAFRFLLNADKATLDPATALQRDRFLGKHNEVQQMITGADAIRKVLEAIPQPPKPDSPDSRKQEQLLKQLAGLSSIGETTLARYALSREPSNLAFPPPRQLQTIRQGIPPGTLCLSTLKTDRGYHLFFVSRDRVRYAGLVPSRKLEADVTKLLRELGAIGGSSTDAATLLKEDWKEIANEVKRSLFAEIPDQSFTNLVELIVIPDGMLWYAPFEALPLEVDVAAKFLIDLCPIRYAPTMSLAIESAGGKELKKTSVAVGAMHSRGEIETTQTEVKELLKTLPDLISSEKQTSPSGLSAWLSDHLMVWSESFLPANGFEFQPVPFENSDHATIESWIELPWYGPEFISLPGLRTFGKGRKANGSEMFVTTTALMAAGSRTVMLPRWPTGGAISLGLSRLYAQHLADKKTPAKALQHAMYQARDLKFDIEKEPQIKPTKDLGDVSAGHPFFWASFFVIDQPRPKPEAPVGVNPPPVGVNPPVAVPTGNVPGATTPNPPQPGSATKGSSTTTPSPGSATKGSSTQTPSSQGSSTDDPAPSPVEKPVPETE